jgi:hypothetical protein
MKRARTAKSSTRATARHMMAIGTGARIKPAPEPAGLAIGGSVRGALGLCVAPGGTPPPVPGVAGEVPGTCVTPGLGSPVGGLAFGPAPPESVPGFCVLPGLCVVAPGSPSVAWPGVCWPGRWPPVPGACPVPVPLPDGVHGTLPGATTVIPSASAASLRRLS